MSRESEILDAQMWRYHMLGVNGDDRTHDWLVLEREHESLLAEVVRLRTALREAERFCARSGACGATIRDALCNES